MQPIQLREERNFSEIINTTFQFAIQNIRTLGPILLYFAAPFSLISGISVGLFQSRMIEMASNPVTNRSPLDALVGVEYLVSILFNLLAYAVLAVVVNAYLIQYQDNDGKVDPADIWPLFIRKIGPVVVMHILYGLSLLAGFVFCFFPAVYPYTIFSISTTAMIREDLGPVDGMARSASLIQLSFTEGFSTFGLRILMTFAVSLMGGVLSIPLYLMMGLQALKVIGDNLQWAIILTAVISSTGSTVLWALVDLSMGFQYFSLTEKKEGYGLMEQIQAIGEQSHREEF